MNAVIVANGDLRVSARLHSIWRQADLRIAADGGAQHAREYFQLAPHIAIGDFDSLDAETARWLELNHVDQIHHPRAKDQTDLELALDLAKLRGADELTIIGALGGRIDQTLANIHLLMRAQQIKIVDGDAEMWVARDKSEIVGEVGEIVSLIPLSMEAEGIETNGLVYPLKQESLIFGTTRGISNELSEPRAHVRIEKGLLLIVHLFKFQGG